MLTDIQHRSFEPAAHHDLAPRIESYLARSSITEGRNHLGDVTLALPGHRPTMWPKKAYQHREDAASLLLSFLLEEFRPKVFFDIGAAQGYFARAAAARLIDPPFVHAFEMRPKLLTALGEWIERDRLTNRIALHQTALSDAHVGEKDVWFVRTRLFEREPAPHEHREQWWRRLKFYLKGENRGPIKARVTVTSIDHFVATHGAVPDLLKIDVDGFEANVLKGGLRTFADHKPKIMLELHKDALMRSEERRADIVAMLLDLGYRALFLTDHHDAKACRLIDVGHDHPLIARQETDFILFC